MLNEVEWSELRTYETFSEDEPMQFYLDALCNSKRFDLLLGYFSSAAINVLSLGFASFLSSGGTVRMVINNVLSKADRDAIANSENVNPNALFDLSDVQALKRTLDDYGKHFFECLSWLIANERIQIVIIKPKGRGISHYKSGTFYDGKVSVGFNASCNFTAYGLLENLEELEAKLSWDDELSSRKITRQVEKFEKIFSGSATHLEYVSAKDVEVAIRKEFGNKSRQELIIQEQELLERKMRLFDNKRVRKVMERVVTQIEIAKREPRFPHPVGPRDYQTAAYRNWIANNEKGIFAMATGTGKTITALNCVLEQCKQDGEQSYHALILVPTITLVEQWEKEVHAFNFQNILKVSSKTDWQKPLTTLLSTAKRIPTSFVIISTYASFVKEKFQQLVKELPTDTIFIADEGHNLASQSVANRLVGFPLEKRIGLSATPKRIYDEDGTSFMETFFEDREPYTFNFSMERAIGEGILSEYYYYPRIVRLTVTETQEYMDISSQLSRLWKFNQPGGEQDERIQRLLLKRKRIIHKATNKLSATIEILNEQFVANENLRFTFIYVPEGETFEIAEDDGEDSIENIRLINQYTREIAKIEGSIVVNQFISGQQDRSDVLRQFEKGEIHVIASMKCLDEGVDIPRAENAIFCSSTGNPRQFIQRRGRILRKHPNKKYATIHDLVVVPDYEIGTDESGTFEIEKRLLKKELERVMYFASLSRNPYFTDDLFSEVCEHFGLNIYSIQHELATV